jgi:ADP-ribose 1''-phosphate phosphatase
MELEYTKGDLFKVAPQEAYLLHACNCQGQWGAGIARDFKTNYPMDYIEYVKDCKKTSPGDMLITKNGIICLYTSLGFGKRTDEPQVILENTKEALANLATKLKTHSVIYSCKINSGLFKVDWAATELLILDFLKARKDVRWVVVDYDK